MTSKTQPLNIQRVDARTGAIEVLQQLRDKLSPQGDVVSPRGRALTEEVFGKPLSPVEVVQTICDDVRREGTPALLRYNKSLDKSELAGSDLRVPTAELAKAHALRALYRDALNAGNGLEPFAQLVDEVLGRALARAPPLEVQADEGGYEAFDEPLGALLLQVDDQLYIVTAELETVEIDEGHADVGEQA